MMKTSIIILTHNQLKYTVGCIESIRKYTRQGTYEIIIVDNKSTDGTREWLSNQKDILTIFNDENLGFPKGCNQGIEVSSGQYILLLNNDVIVTENWLDNLKRGLESADSIGAVGPITNNCSYYQSIKVDYKSEEEMQAFAKNINASGSSKWEKKLKLVGFCMLIKREVIDKIGLLDERFSPGNFEDDDYSYRILQAGYQLLLCYDTFIHHYGSVSFKEKPQAFSDLLNKNRQKFIDKWGFDSHYSSFIRYDIIRLMDKHDTEAPLNVLEVGCACGATLLEIKNYYKNATLYGIEFNKESAAISSLFANVIAADVEKQLDYQEDFFDYIILPDVLEHLNNPWQVLKDLKKHLKPNGRVLSSIPNIMHFSVLRDLINGRWNYTDSGLLDRTHLRFFTLHEIIKMFTDAEYFDISCEASRLEMRKEDEEWVEGIKNLSLLQSEKQFMAYQYLVKAYKNDKQKELNLLIQNLLVTDDHSSLITIKDNLLTGLITTENLLIAITGVPSNQHELYNYLAIFFYNEGLLDYVIPLLSESLTFDSKHKETLYNLGYIMYKVGESELALEYLNQIEDKELDVEVMDLIELVADLIH